MKKSTLAAGLALLVACEPSSDDTPLGTGDAGSAPTPVYVTIYSHNEDSWSPHVKVLESYRNYRQDLIERLQIIAKYEATLNWQSDSVVVQAMSKHENESLYDASNGKNILRYMVEDFGYSVDPHTHKGNFADIAHDMTSLGIQPSGVVGGIQVWQCGTSPQEPLSFVDYYGAIGIESDGYVHGVVNDTPWKPEILTGPAFGGHFFDEMSSGVWRPGNQDEFYDNDPSNPMVYVGQGDPHDQLNLGQVHASGAVVAATNGQYIKELIGRIRSGDLPADKLYTASIHVRDKPTVEDQGINVNEGLEQILNELQPYVATGEISYKTYQDVAALWGQQHAAAPYYVTLDTFSMYQSLYDSVLEECFP